MPFLLRIIRKSKWYKAADAVESAPSDFPADPLADLNTKENKLSVWYVHEDKSNLERIAAAIGATRDFLVPLDYALFDYDLASNVKIELSSSDGSTHDKHVNVAWHRDLIELSALTLVDIARELAKRMDRIPEKEIGQLIATAVANGQIDESKLSKNILAKLEIG